MQFPSLTFCPLLNNAISLQLEPFRYWSSADFLLLLYDSLSAFSFGKTEV